MDLIKLNSFLKFGYFIDYQSDQYQLNYSGINRALYENYSETELVSIGRKKFLQVIADEFVLGQTHVVPLSGGLDSRAILAALLKFTSAAKIKTYTFGTPGTLDYEIGNLVARKVGTDHQNFPLTKHIYSQEELVESSRLTKHQTVLFHHPPIFELKNQYQGCQIWSGYVGDVVAGGYIPVYKSGTIEEAKLKYINKYSFIKSIDLTCCSEKEYLKKIDADWLDPEILSYEEQLIYEERSRKLTAPHILIDHFQYKTPFINNEFMDFMFSLEENFRKDQYLYKKILIRISKELFSIKTKNNYGLPLNAGWTVKYIFRAINKGKRIFGKYFSSYPNPGTNYLEFDKAIRNKKDFKEIIFSNIQDLKKRGLVEWIDMDALWDRHMQKKVDHSDALLVLASLEIHLKALD
jgi:asparagine synthetase B (glutamine-hydrolysing)